MKNLTVRLTDDEYELVEIVVKSSKFKKYKEPKVAYMETIRASLSTLK